MTSPSANTLGFVVASEQPGGGGVGEGGKMCPEAETDTPASERLRPLVKGYLMGQNDSQKRFRITTPQYRSRPARRNQNRVELALAAHVAHAVLDGDGGVRGGWARECEGKGVGEEGDAVSLRVDVRQ